MQDQPPQRPKPEEPSATGSWPPAADRTTGAGFAPAPIADESPTVRRGPGGSGSAHNAGGSGSASGSGARGDGRAGSGSGGGLARGPMEAGLPVPGDRLDSFEVQQAIGVGGMGAVFRALDVRLDRFVALKVLPPGQAYDAENARRFYQEGRAAARLDHENIARIYTIGQDKGLHYIAFEYIDGTTIRQRVERHGPLSVAEAINYTLQIAGALVHASERGVVHRDIKPSNIIVTPQGRAKLVDMGLARRFEREGADDGLTQSNMTLGTFDYISPEQARDPRSVDVRSDLYSLGCTIYHMLTGQPPFPGGTVLQKLLSHREEPAPDVRGLNPAVPADLAAIVLKLMAKDPDRRYQSPEQLVRDLLTLAGALGLRSISPEGLVWMSAAPRAPGWERHLFWAVPAAALALVVAALVWMGRDPEAEALAALPADPADSLAPVAPLLSPTETAAPREATAPAVVGPAGGQGPGAAGAGTAAAGPPAARPGASPTLAASPPRVVRVGADEDLRAVLRAEPPGSTIILADDGPYLLAPPGPGDPPIRADVTIRAAVDARPVLAPAPGGDAPAGGAPLLHLDGGRVAIEGLTFALGAASGPAIRAEGTALTLSQCDFRGSGRPAALELIAPESAAGAIGPDPARMSVLLEACTLAGGRVGVSARGPVTLGLRGCLVAERGPAVWFDNAPAGTTASAPDFGFGPVAAAAAPTAPPVPARLVLDRVSMLVGPEPALRFDGTAIRVEASDLLAAPPRVPEFGSGRTVLVAIDDPGRLSWSGVNNLYARIDQYLSATAGGAGRPRIFEFDAWADGLQVAEVGSAASTEHIWAEDDPAAALSREVAPALAFRTAGAASRSSARPGQPPAPSAGAPGPVASLGARGAAAGPGVPPSADAAPAPTEIDPARLTGFDPDPMDLGPMVLSSNPGPTATPVAPGAESTTSTAGTPSRANEPVEAELPPFYREGPGRPVAPERVADAGRTTPPADATRLPAAEAGPASQVASTPAAAEADDGGPIRTMAQLLDRLAALGPKGGVLRLAADARLDLPALDLDGSGIVEILAEPSPSRPVLRFRPAPLGLASASAPPAMIRVDRRGELRLRGVDVVLPADAAPGSGPWSAFALDPEATLDLTECTVSVDGPASSSAIRLIADEPAAGLGAGAAPPPSPSTPAGSGPAGIRIVDSLVRCADDVIDASPGSQADVELSNAVVSCGGSLLLGRGRAAVGAGGAEPRLALQLRRVTALARGGIVRLDGAADRSALPLAEVSARESVLGTGPDGGALFRVDGQGDLGVLGDRIRVVESREVAYHLVDEYRRDQAAQPGSLPVVLDRDEWALAVGRVEADARHGDAGFLDEDAPASPPLALRPEDVRLDPDGEAGDLGPDLDRIPPPPDPASVAASDPAASPSRPGAEVLDRLRRALLPGLP